MKPIYIVTFETHKDCQIRNYVYHCQAQNAKEACEIAKYGGFYGTTECKANKKLMGHMFHVHAVKSRVQEVEKLTVRTWKGNTFTGEQVMKAIDFDELLDPAFAEVYRIACEMEHKREIDPECNPMEEFCRDCKQIAADYNEWQAENRGENELYWNKLEDYAREKLTALYPID